MITNLTGCEVRRHVCKACKKVVGETWSTYAIRRVVTARRVRRAHLKIFASPSRNATATLEFRSVSIITRDVHRRKEPYVRLSVVVLRVEHLWRSQTTNVIKEIANQYKKAGLLCFMRPLLNMLPAGDRFFSVFYGLEATQDSRYSDWARSHVPNLQQFPTGYEDEEDVERHCVQCGMRKHPFWDDPVGSMLSYLLTRALRLTNS